MSCSHVLTPYVCSVQAFVHSCQSDLSCHVTQPWPRDLPSLPLLALRTVSQRNRRVLTAFYDSCRLIITTGLRLSIQPPQQIYQTHQPLLFWHLCISLYCLFHLNSTCSVLHTEPYTLFCFRVKQKW